MHKNAADWAKVGVRLVQIDSTNDELHRRILSAQQQGILLPDGYSVRADYQSQGRGQYNRNWESAPGRNLSVSFFLAGHDLPAEQAFALSQSVALAVRAAVQEAGISAPCSIKWPNDIFIHDRKVAGILLSNSIAGSKLVHTVAGIGININQTDFSNLPRATSMRLCAGRSFDVQKVWRILACKLQDSTDRLHRLARQGDLYALQQEYHAHLYGLQRVAVFEQQDDAGRIIGTIRGVRADGQLRLERGGSEQLYTLGELRFLEFVE